MRISLLAVLLLAALGTDCLIARSATTNATLTFHIVSEHRVPGGRFIDTPSLPKVGYVSNTPDLVVTNLQEVMAVKAAESHAIRVDKDGVQTIVPTRSPPCLQLTFWEKDAERFLALTEKAIGKRLLVMLENDPLSAPIVRAPIEGGAVLMPLENEAMLKTKEEALKKLVR